MFDFAEETRKTSDRPEPVKNKSKQKLREGADRNLQKNKESDDGLPERPFDFRIGAQKTGKVKCLAQASHFTSRF